MKARIAMILLCTSLIGLSLMGLAGCATTGQYDGWVSEQRGDYKLITRNDEIYMEKLDGSESRQLTHTPNYPSGGARFIQGGKYIVYAENNGSIFDTGKAYIIPADGDDSQRKEITEREYIGLR